MAFRISKYLFLALIASIPIFRPSLIRIYSPIPATDILFLASAFLFAIAVALRQFRPVYDRAFMFIAAFGAALALSAAFSPDALRSSVKLAGHFYLFGLTFLTVQFAQDENFLKQAVIAFIAGLFLTVLAAAAGFALFFAGYTTFQDNYFLYHLGTLPAGHYPRIRALFANPNMLCSYLAAAAPLLLMAIRAGWIGKRTGVFLFTGSMITALFSISPGIGGVILAVMIWYVIVYGDGISRRLRNVVIAGGVLAAAAFFVSAAVTFDTSNPTPEFCVPGTAIVIEPAVRVLTWQSALRTFSGSPVVGVGTGMNAAWVPYTPLAGPNQLLLDAHNAWLSVAAQTGIIGLASFCLLLWHLYTRTLFTAERGSGDSQLLLIAASCSFAGAFLYQGLTGAFEDARHVWLIFGLLIAADRAFRQHNSSAV